MKNSQTLKFTVFLFFCISFFNVGCGNDKNGDQTAVKDSIAPLTGKFLTLSDVHFDPFYDTSLVKQLVKADVKDWEKIFKSSKNKNYGVYGKDSDFNLMSSAFDKMKSVDPDPDFIVITGDFLSHTFQHTFDTITRINDVHALHSFIAKTTQFIAMQLVERFPKTPIYPVLGNNDDFCGDYMIQPNDPFLPVFSKAWAPCLHSIKGENTFAKSVDTAGYYIASLPGFPNHVIIGLNSIFFSDKNISTCMETDTTSGQTEMNWLSSTLAYCQQKNMKVWFTCHIPPGVNVKSTAKEMAKDSTNCGEKIKMMWTQQYNDEFLALENQYSSIITGALAGHTHMDDFRVVSDTSGNPISFFHINPSISPIDGNNSGFQVFTYDTSGMIMLDYETYAFQGLYPPYQPTWTMEYDYGKTYGQINLSGTSFSNICKEFSSDTTMRGEYQLYYGMGSPLSEAKPWEGYGCGLNNMSENSFGNCTCGSSSASSKKIKSAKKIKK